MRKLQFCSGGMVVPGFESFDMDVDIRNALPFASGCASHIYIEHGLEHVTHRQGWNFLEECHRLLSVGGVIRVAIPDINRIWAMTTQAYWDAASHFKTKEGAIWSSLFNHGHASCWNDTMLIVILHSVGFKSCERCIYSQSAHPEFQNIEQHWRTVGETLAVQETSIVEGTK